MARGLPRARYSGFWARAQRGSAKSALALNQQRGQADVPRAGNDPRAFEREPRGWECAGKGGGRRQRPKTPTRCAEAHRDVSPLPLPRVAQRSSTLTRLWFLEARLEPPSMHFLHDDLKCTPNAKRTVYLGAFLSGGSKTPELRDSLRPFPSSTNSATHCPKHDGQAS